MVRSLSPAEDERAIRGTLWRIMERHCRYRVVTPANSDQRNPLRLVSATGTGTGVPAADPINSFHTPELPHV